MVDNCLNCGNCKQGDTAYYCIACNEIIVVEKDEVLEKVRSGWKKGSKEYENHRRKNRTEMSEV